MLKCSLFNKILSILSQHFLPDSIRTAKRSGAILYVILIIVFHLQILLCLKWSVPVLCNPDLANVTFTDICPVYYNMCSTDVLAFRAVSRLINYALWTKLSCWKGSTVWLCGCKLPWETFPQVQSRMSAILLTRVGIASVCSLKVGTEITFCATLVWQ